MNGFFLSTVKKTTGENFLLFPNKFDEFSVWQQYGTAFIPDEVAGDWTLPLTTGAGFYQICPHVFPEGVSVCFSIEVKSCAAGTKLGIYEGAPTYGLLVELDISGLVNGSTFQRLFVAAVLPPGMHEAVVDFGNQTANGDAVIRKAMLNTGTTPGPYVE